MKNHVLALLTGFIGLAIVLAGCNRGQVSVDETYAAMRPLKQLELPDQVTDNLVIIVSNVADQSSSYKNYIELEINDRKVRPNWDVSNIENTYTYRLRLRPGYYKVKAHYYAYIGWGEDRYPIETEDLVQVTSLQRTVLTCNIVKRPNGEPVDKKMYFKTQNEPFDTSLIGPSVAQPVAAEPAAKPADAPTVVQAPLLLFPVCRRLLRPLPCRSIRYQSIVRSSSMIRWSVNPRLKLPYRETATMFCRLQPPAIARVSK
jgi:hypothetical protein